MRQWYSEFSITDWVSFGFLAVAFVFVMTASFFSLLHSRYGWYRGVHSTPLFQFVMWIGMLPLIPLYLFWSLRSRRKFPTAKYIGNLRSYVFHRRGCEYEQQIQSRSSRYALPTVDEAYRRGFRPCNFCNPR
jgi:hypothetical protein